MKKSLIKVFILALVSIALSNTNVFATTRKAIGPTFAWYSDLKSADEFPLWSPNRGEFEDYLTLKGKRFGLEISSTNINDNNHFTFQFSTVFEVSTFKNLKNYNMNSEDGNTFIADYNNGIAILGSIDNISYHEIALKEYIGIGAGVEHFTITAGVVIGPTVFWGYRDGLLVASDGNKIAAFDYETKERDFNWYNGLRIEAGLWLGKEQGCLISLFAEIGGNLFSISQGEYTVKGLSSEENTDFTGFNNMRQNLGISVKYWKK